MQLFRLIPALAVVLIAALGTATARAADAVVVDPSFSQLSLEQHIDVFEDPVGKMDFDAVRNTGAFKTAPSVGTNFGFTRSAWWLRFTLSNPGEHDYQAFLREDYPLIDYLDLWAEHDDDTSRHTATGDRTPFGTREFNHRDFLFELTVPAHSQRTYYVRGATDGALDLSLRLYSPHALIGTLSDEQLAYGVYYGGFIVLVLYNFFIFLIARDRAFFYYLLYATSYGMYFAIHNGLAFEFFWPNAPEWGNQALLVMLAFALIFGLQFTRTFLDTAGFARRLDRVAVAMQVLAGLGLAASFFLAYGVLILPLAVLTIFVTVMIMTLGTLGLLKGYQPARYFMIAWAMLLVGVLAYMLKVFGLLPHNMLTQNGFQVGSLMEMVLLSLALASRLRDLRRQSRTDTLTKVPNRRFFDEHVAIEFDRARRSQNALALLVVDIDHFKQFNDRYGHARGDEVLKTVAERLCQGVRRGDSVCRYGGEEFALILPGANAAAAAQIAEVLRSTLENNPMPEETVTISIGVASTKDGHFDSAYELFQAADRALYRAKDLGRNRVVQSGAP
jgi:two-component system, sensor histidine kinase LadS